MSEEQLDVVVACCQVELAIGDKAGNLARLESSIRRAADAGARIVVLPELANTGYMFGNLDELRAAAEPTDGATILRWQALARELDLVIVGGFAELNVEPGADDEVHNSAVIVDASGIRAVYRKVHLWDNEKNGLFSAGTGAPPVVDTEFGRIAVMICYDAEFPEWVRDVALRGADLLCCPVNWPLYPRPEGERPAEIVRLQAAASTNRMFIAAADRARDERGQKWLGGSVIVDADGFPVATTALGEPGILTASLRLADARSKAISTFNDVHADRRPELYSRVVREKRAAH